ncbi:hypothetical protein BC2230_100081 [Burkholderia cepacia]
MILLAERVTAEFRIAGNASLVRAGFAYDGVILASVRQACTIGFLLSGSLKQQATRLVEALNLFR